MKKLLSLSLALLAAAAMTVPTLAASHTVQRGDTMWKLAVQYQVGTSEIIDANPQVANPNLIYPGDVLTMPAGTRHTVSAETELKIIEVQLGPAISVEDKQKYPLPQA